MSGPGLSDREATERHGRGLGNRMPPATDRTYRRILRENVVTFINGVIFALCLALLALGQWSDALVSVAVISVNVLVGLVQEVRAKRILDRIAVLTRPKATVFRDGSERDIEPDRIVVGDALVVRPGDQVLVDGPIVDGRIEVDESLLTGESDPVSRAAGDELRSGSVCVSGTATYEARAVGDDCLANRLTRGARAFRKVQTPLQRQVLVVVRVLLLVAVSFGVLLVAAAVIDGLPPVEIVRIAVVVAGLVPNGLFLAMAAAYAMGAVRIAGRGALVQRSNAIESLSNVDVLCFDKTGTLTSGRLDLLDVHPFAVAEDEARMLLGDFAASETTTNRTSRAIIAGCPGRRRAVREEMPFASDRRWSALVLEGQQASDVLVLGAPDALGSRLPPDTRAEVDAAVADATARGLRVVLFCRGTASGSGEPSVTLALPDALTPIGLVTLRDELRENVRDCLKAFSAAGITMKLISGDHPVTARAVAMQAGLPSAFRTVLGDELAAADPHELRRLARDATVFARVAPQQKELLVRTLREVGQYVAMIGDGVNDVPSLKRADLAVALQSGAPAARAVADIVLLEDSFATLPAAFREGQRIVNGMQVVLQLFLTRITYMVLLIAGTALVDATFPFTPKQNAVVTLFTVGIPAIALAAWARPTRVARGHLVGSLLHFVLPAGWSFALFGLILYLAYPAGGGSAELARSALTAFSVFGGIGLVLLASPPVRGWSDGVAEPGEARSVLLAAILFGGFLWVALQAGASGFFDLAPLSEKDLALVGIVAIAWVGAVRWIWRARLMERLLGLERSEVPATA